MAQRYCTNCGSELGSDDAFCASCGRPAHETAAISTPEADVGVPPPPQQQRADEAQNFAPTGAAPRRRLWVGLLAGCGGISALLVLFVGCLAVLGSGSGGGGQASSDGGENPPSPDTANAGGPSGDQYASSIGTFTRANYGILAANPDEHAGTNVDVVGQLLDNPESSGDEVVFQMWADPANADWSTVVHADAGALGLRSNNYVHVKGEVLGSMEGENAFGGTVSAVEVDADTVERVEGVDAIDPTQETLEVGQTRSGEGFSVTLDSIDLGAKHARARVSASNPGDKNVKLNLDRSKIVQGGDRIGSRDPYDYSLPKPKSGLPPGDETEGVVIFGRPDASEPFQVSFAWERGGFMAKKPDPLVFQVEP